MKQSKIEYRVHNLNTHCLKSMEKKTGVKLISGEKKVIKFKELKGWEVHSQPSVEFYNGKKVVGIEWVGNKAFITSFSWISKKKNGDLKGIKDFRTIEV